MFSAKWGIIKDQCFHEKLPDMRQLRSIKFGDQIKYDQRQTGKEHILVLYMRTCQKDVTTPSQQGQSTSNSERSKKL